MQAFDVVFKLANVEKSFLTRLETFIAKTVLPIQSSDTILKRSLLNNVSVSACFNLLRCILQSSATFIENITIAYETSDNEGIATSYEKISASLQNYSSYASIVCDTINMFHIKNRIICKEIITCDLYNESFEDSFLLPLRHYQEYANFLKKLIEYPEMNFHAMHQIYNIILKLTNDINNKILEENDHFKLLSIQKKCNFCIKYLANMFLLLSHILFCSSRWRADDI